MNDYEILLGSDCYVIPPEWLDAMIQMTQQAASLCDQIEGPETPLHPYAKGNW